MALQFLQSALSSIGPLSQILGAVRGITGQRKQRKLFGEIANQGASEEEKYAISRQMALAEPNNSLVNSLQDEEFQLLMNALNQGIRGKVLSDRRESSLGRRPTYFDPERADENISFQLSRGAPAALLQARQNALSRIQGAATGVGAFAPASSQRQTARLGARQDTLDYNSQQNPLSSIQTILEAIQGISGASGRNGARQGQSYANPNIRGTRYLT